VTVAVDDEPPRHPHHHERLEHLEEHLEELLEAAVEVEQHTGRREETVEEAKRSLLRRVLRVSAGAVVACIGLVLLVLPGPGLVVLASGLAIMAVDVPFAARWLHKVRQRIPEGEDGKVATWVIVASVAGVVASTGGSVWWTFLR
jgi:hypothetical protein